MERCTYIWTTGGKPRRCDKEAGHGGIGHSCSTDDDYDVFARLAAAEARAEKAEGEVKYLRAWKEWESDRAYMQGAYGSHDPERNAAWLAANPEPQPPEGVAP